MTTLFKQAHDLTRATIQQGDDYQATFTLCLRAIIADNKARLVEHSLNTVFEAINYQAPTYSTVPSLPPKAVWNTKHPLVKACLAIKSLGIEVFILLAALTFIVGLFIGGKL